MSNKEIDVSVVVPLFNEEESLPELHKQIVTVVEAEKLSAEIVFVDPEPTCGITLRVGVDQ